MTQLYAQLDQFTAAAPPPPPATWDAYQKKDGKSNGVRRGGDLEMIETFQKVLKHSSHTRKTHARLMRVSRSTSTLPQEKEQMLQRYSYRALVGGGRNIFSNSSGLSTLSFMRNWSSMKVIALMDMLLKELQDGIVEAENEEKTAQSDYERLMSESTESRATMVESITSKEVAKADLDSKIEATKEKKTSEEAQLSNIKQTIAQLHADCDFIVENYDLRKAARENEIEGLANAKSVLSGADFGL